MNTITKGILFTVVAQILFGTNPPFLKWIDNDIPASLVITFRFLIASTVLFTYIFSRKETRQQLFSLSKKNLFEIFILTIIAAVIADLFMLTAIRNTGVIIGIIVERLEIPLSIILAAIFLKERITRKVVIATVVSFIGLIFISMKQDVNITLSNTFYFGIFSALMAAIAWAFSTVYSKKIINSKVPVLILTGVRMLMATIFNFIIALITVHNVPQQVTQIAVEDWLKLLYVGVFTTAISFFAYYKGLELLPANTASVFLSMSTVIAVLIGYFMGENLSTLQWIGVGLVFCGIVILNLRKKEVKM